MCPGAPDSDRWDTILVRVEVGMNGECWRRQETCTVRKGVESRKHKKHGNRTLRGTQLESSDRKVRNPELSLPWSSLSGLD